MTFRKENPRRNKWLQFIELAGTILSQIIFECFEKYSIL